MRLLIIISLLALSCSKKEATETTINQMKLTATFALELAEKRYKVLLKNKTPDQIYAPLVQTVDGASRSLSMIFTAAGKRLGAVIFKNQLISADGFAESVRKEIAASGYQKNKIFTKKLLTEDGNNTVWYAKVIGDYPSKISSPIIFVVKYQWQETTNFIKKRLNAKASHPKKQYQSMFEAEAARRLKSYVWYAQHPSDERNLVEYIASLPNVDGIRIFDLNGKLLKEKLIKKDLSMPNERFFDLISRRRDRYRFTKEELDSVYKVRGELSKIKRSEKSITLSTFKQIKKYDSKIGGLRPNSYIWIQLSVPKDDL